MTHNCKSIDHNSLRSVSISKNRSLTIGIVILITVALASTSHETFAEELKTVQARSGIQLDVAKWVPKFGYQGQWGVVPAGTKPQKMLHWANSTWKLLLPPGTYDVYWKQSYSHKSIRLDSNVIVGQNELKTVHARSGIQLDVAKWVPKFGYQGQWGVVPAGTKPEKMLHWANSTWQLLLPPGKYDVYWKQSYGQKPVILQRNVEVTRNDSVTATAQKK